MKLKAVNKKVNSLFHMWKKIVDFYKKVGTPEKAPTFPEFAPAYKGDHWFRKRNAPTARALCRAERNADATHRDLYPEQYDDNGRLIPAQRQYGIRK